MTVSVPFNIKVRLLQLGMTQRELTHKLNENGFPDLSANMFLKYLNGYMSSERRDAVLSKANEIITQLENENND